MSASRMITGLIGAFGGGAVGRMLGGRTGGMIGSMAGSMLSRRSGGIGSLLSGLMPGGKDDNAASAAVEMSDDEATIFIRAMCSAAKADGNVDDDEVNRIVSKAGDLDANDEAMLRRELNSPLDLAGLVASVPRGLEAEIYAASLLPITVDEASEVDYLRQLASGLGLDSDTINKIHRELGAG